MNPLINSILCAILFSLGHYYHEDNVLPKKMDERDSLVLPGVHKIAVVKVSDSISHIAVLSQSKKVVYLLNRSLEVVNKFSTPHNSVVNDIVSGAEGELFLFTGKPATAYRCSVNGDVFDSFKLFRSVNFSYSGSLLYGISGDRSSLGQDTSGIWCVKPNGEEVYFKDLLPQLDFNVAQYLSRPLPPIILDNQMITVSRDFPLFLHLDIAGTLKGAHLIQHERFSKATEYNDSVPLGQRYFQFTAIALVGDSVLACHVVEAGYIELVEFSISGKVTAIYRLKTDEMEHRAICDITILSEDPVIAGIVDGVTGTVRVVSLPTK